MISDSRASFFSASSLFGRDVKLATNSPTQPRNTIAVEIYPNHSQQLNDAFRDPTSESVRIILRHQKREQRDLIACLVPVSPVSPPCEDFHHFLRYHQ
jgi:hypothetical protein